MAQSLSRKELIHLYKSRKKGVSESSESVDDVVPGTDVLERLKKLSYVNSLKAVNPAEAPGPILQKTIAICLVIVDALPHEDIWRAWMQQASEYSAQLYIHAKFPDRITSPWARSRTLDMSFFPEWNSPEVIRAILASLSWAIEDQSCGRFVFGTESCIPVCSLQEAGNELFARDRSWLDAYHRPKDGYEEQYCFFAVNPSIIPNKDVWKALPGWVMLTRQHAQDILSLPKRVGTDDLVLAWNTVHAPEEVYFATLLAILGHLRTSGVDAVDRRRVTYAQWAKKGDANPIRFDALTEELLRDLRASGSIFARKFGAGSVSVAEWIRLLTIVCPQTALKRTSATAFGDISVGETGEIEKDSHVEHESPPAESVGGGKSEIAMTSPVTCEIDTSRICSSEGPLNKKMRNDKI